MLKKFILNLRQKPKHVRDRVALFVAVSFTTIVFTVWLYHAPARHAALQMKSLDGVANESPGFSELFGTIGDTVSSFKEFGEDASTTMDSLVLEEEIPTLSSSTEQRVLFVEGKSATSTDLPITFDDASSLFNFDTFDDYYEPEPELVREVRVVSVSSTTPLESAESAP